MKMLDEAGKKRRMIAKMMLVTGKKKEKEAAKKFLADIGLSDAAIKNIEGKKKVEEDVDSECGCGSLDESVKELIMESTGLSEKEVEEINECDCQNCDHVQYSHCNKPTKKSKKKLKK